MAGVIFQDRRLGFRTGAWWHAFRGPIILLSCVGVMLWRSGSTAADANPQDFLAPVLATGNPIAVLSLDRLSATRDRPLFSATRRPPSALISRLAASDPVPLVLPVSPPTLVLVGVVTEANGGFALVRTPNQAGTHRIRVGDQIDGWRVAQIAPRRLFLARQDRSAAFTLFQGDGGPTVGALVPTEPRQREKERPQAEPRTQVTLLRIATDPDQSSGY
jgi:hypothetical protein